MRPSKSGATPIRNSINSAFGMRKEKRKVQEYNATILSTRGNDDSESTDRIVNKGIMVDRHIDIHFESGFLVLSPELGEDVR